MFQWGFILVVEGILDVTESVGFFFFFSRFPTTGSEVTAETRRRVSPSPTVSTHSHGGQMSVKDVSLLS